MRSKVVILYATWLLLLVGLNETASSQLLPLTTKVSDDTCDILIESTTAYPGTETWITVWMKNPVPVIGYQFYLTIVNYPAPARFPCDTSGYWCFLDTVGCLTSILPNVSCICQENGMGAQIVAFADTEEIPPSPNYNCLFKIRLDACCIPDADTNRSASLYFAPGLSYLVDRLGYVIPSHYQPGELFVWWSLPGDANGDSLVNISDVIFLTNYLFIRGPEPCVCEAADCNNDNVINSADIAYLINYLFVNGPAPIPGSKSCWYETCRPY
jgi:hypothetical protein